MILVFAVEIWLYEQIANKILGNAQRKIKVTAKKITLLHQNQLPCMKVEHATHINIYAAVSRCTRDFNCQAE